MVTAVLLAFFVGFGAASLLARRAEGARAREITYLRARLAGDDNGRTAAARAFRLIAARVASEGAHEPRIRNLLATADRLERGA